MNRCKAVLSMFVVTALCGISSAQNPAPRLELNRKGETIVLEPYAPNILRVTLSLQRDSPPLRSLVMDLWRNRMRPAGPNLKPRMTISIVRRALLPRLSARIRPGLRRCIR